jgi:hypothetical protein
MIGQQFRLVGLYNNVQIHLIVPAGTMVTVHNMTRSGLCCVHTSDGLTFNVSPNYLEPL